MNKYLEYKDSGVEWIGEIPIHWTLQRVMRVFSERQEKVDDKTFPPLSVTMNGVVDQLPDVAKTNHSDNRKLAKKGDFVINSRSDRKGSSGISPRDGSVSVINIVMEPRKPPSSFYEHLFKSFYFKEEFFRNGKGIVWDLWSTKWGQLKTILIPIPTQNEQFLISRYLDKKISQIDSLIEKISQKIELLKEQRTSLINQCVTKGLDLDVEMKDSGVEWIDKIPAHWEEKKVKHCCHVTLGKMLTPEDKGGMFKSSYLRSQNVQDGWLDLNDVKEMWFSDQEASLLELETNDLLVNEGGQVGRSALWDGSIKPCYFQNSLNRVRPFNGDQFFFLYLFQSYFHKGYFDSIVDRVSIPHLTKEKLLEIKILCPSLKEQKIISKHLDKKTSQIDSLIEKETRRIELLKEYRQSLISNVVTGKVRITEEMI